MVSGSKQHPTISSGATAAVDVAVLLWVDSGEVKLLVTLRWLGSPGGLPLSSGNEPIQLAHHIHQNGQQWLEPRPYQSYPDLFLWPGPRDVTFTVDAFSMFK